jgi:hypothetical protein
MVGNHAGQGAYAFIPVGGSFAALSGIGSVSYASGILNEGPDLQEMAGLLFALVVGGLMQTGGLVVLTVGLADRHPVLAVDPKSFPLRPTPFVGNGATGFGLSGTF